MSSLTAYVPRAPKDCWRAFLDIAALPLWVPGLRRAQVLSMSHGRPDEIHFEFGASLVYTLVYSYDVERLEIRWQPKLGKRDGVTGWVRFDPFDDGTRVTYALEPSDGRTESDRQLDDPQALLDAFGAWMRRAR